MIERFTRWLGSLFGAGIYLAEACEDEPDHLAPRRVYLIGDADAPWSASLVCPCGCGETIRLSLLPDDRPRWRAQVSSSGAVTLHPSIWRVRGCRSHFFLRHGRIVWARPTTRTPTVPLPPVRTSNDRRV